MQQINVSTLTESPDSTFEMIADGGKMKTVRKYEISEKTWFSSRPLLYSADPEHSTLTLRRYTANRIAGDLRLLTLYYEGEATTEEEEDDPGKNQPIALGALDITLGDEPLLAHSRYSTIPTAERDALVLIFQGQTMDPADNSTKLEDSVTSAEGLEALTKYKKGSTHTREPSIIWTLSSVVTTLQDLNNIGKIDTPGGDVPGLAAGRNWLNIGLTAQQSEDATTFAQSKKWEASGPNGWDPDLYS